MTSTLVGDVAFAGGAAGALTFCLGVVTLVSGDASDAFAVGVAAMRVITAYSVAGVRLSKVNASLVGVTHVLPPSILYSCAVTAGLTSTLVGDVAFAGGADGALTFCFSVVTLVSADASEAFAVGVAAMRVITAYSVAGVRPLNVSVSPVGVTHVLPPSILYSCVATAGLTSTLVGDVAFAGGAAGADGFFSHCALMVRFSAGMVDGISRLQPSNT